MKNKVLLGSRIFSDDKGFKDLALNIKRGVGEVSSVVDDIDKDVDDLMKNPPKRPVLREYWDVKDRIENATKDLSNAENSLSRMK